MKEPIGLRGLLKANGARAVADDAKATADAAAPDIATALSDASDALGVGNAAQVTADAAQLDASQALSDASDAQGDADQALSDAADAAAAALQAQTTANTATLKADAALNARDFVVTVGPWEEVKNPDDDGAFVPVGFFDNLLRESNWGARHLPFGNFRSFYLPGTRAGFKWAVAEADCLVSSGTPGVGEFLSLLVSDTANQVRVKTPAGSDDGVCTITVDTGVNKFDADAPMVLTWATSAMGAMVKQDLHIRLRFTEVAA